MTPRAPKKKLQPQEDAMSAADEVFGSGDTAVPSDGPSSDESVHTEEKITEVAQTTEEVSTEHIPTVEPPMEEETKVDQPKEVEVEEKLDDRPDIVGAARGELDQLIENLEAHVNSVKGQRDIGVESVELVKLSAMKMLREVTEKLRIMQDTLGEMSEIEGRLSVEQKGLERAKEYVDERSASHRIERDAFIKLRGLSEKEYYTLIANIAGSDK